MAASLGQVAKKLILALNTHGYDLTFTTKQFMGVERQLHNLYSVNKATWSHAARKYYNKELYSSTSMVRIVLYLRDMWYKENGWELPTDQALWNEIRAGLPEYQSKEDL